MFEFLNILWQYIYHFKADAELLNLCSKILFVTSFPTDEDWDIQGEWRQASRTPEQPDHPARWFGSVHWFGALASLPSSITPAQPGRHKLQAATMIYFFLQYSFRLYFINCFYLYEILEIILYSGLVRIAMLTV